MINGARECEGIAAFFDLDGTLTPLPSLERQFFRGLRYRREISVRNHLAWLKEALRLMPRGINAIVHANKMYLKGVKSLDESDGEDRSDSSGHTIGHQARGQAATPPRRNPRLPVPHFFAEAVERVAWHAGQGHAIVLVSGTLQPLASAAALALVHRLAVSGVRSSIGVCATRLEEARGRWTGRVLGEAMFGEAKRRAVKRLAEEMQLDLSRCYAYGDGANDRWLLAAVGKPVAVNPSRKLARVARARGWPILYWKEEKSLAHKHSSFSLKASKEPRDRGEPVRQNRMKESELRMQLREGHGQFRSAERWT